MFQWLTNPDRRSGASCRRVRPFCLPLLVIVVFTTAVPACAKPESADEGIRMEEDAAILPGPPGRISVAGGRIKWLGTASDILLAYRVYRRCGDKLELISEVPIQGDNRGWYAFEDAEHAHCRHLVSALDHYGNEGQRAAATLE
jgi:hypothetical protein|tara:strand:+ start:273 stop:704 length:432 start_codon:yes stop_codon:yes gene_type:complete